MQGINKNLLDPHLNIFYSYDGGGNSNKKNKLSQLEDNVTRAFIITLSYLSYENRQRIIKMLIGERVDIDEDFFFDLQNLNENYFKLRNEAKNKILLTITRTGKVSASIDTSKDDQGSRADGWIVSSKIAVLLEVKVRDAVVSKSQIERHIKDSKGFGQSNIAEVTQVHKKWYEIDSFFSQIEKDLGQDAEAIFVFQFRQYLNMIGETMNFRQFYESKELIDDDIRKEQLKLLIDRVNTELDNIDFSVGNEVKDWGYLYYKGKKNPHVSFAISESAIICYLTVSNATQKKYKSFLLNTYFYVELKFICKMEYIIKARYYLSLINYRVIDHRKGQIRGENHGTFSIRLSFCENELRKGKNLQNVIDSMEKCLGLGKQLEFGLTIDFPRNVTVVDEGLMGENKGLLENPDQVVSLFVKFIKEHVSLLDEINKA